MSHPDFTNPFWSGLATKNAQLAIGGKLASRYPAAVIPFGGMPEVRDPACMAAFRDLLSPGEIVYITGDEVATVDGLVEQVYLPGVQMRFAGDPAEAVWSQEAVPLGEAEAQEMVALTDVAFPGYFRPQTWRLGSYYGIRVEGQLIAMAGERVSLPGWKEISAVCTHPDHTGKGYAATLVRHVMAEHRKAGIQSYLHASAANSRAIAIYERLGFTHTRGIIFRGMQLA